MPQEAEPSPELQKFRQERSWVVRRTLAGAGVGLSVLVMTSALLPQDKLTVYQWFSLAFCIISLFVGAGYFSMEIVFGNRFTRHPEIGADGPLSDTCWWCSIIAVTTAGFGLLVPIGGLIDQSFGITWGYLVVLVLAIGGGTLIYRLVAVADTVEKSLEIIEKPIAATLSEKTADKTVQNGRKKSGRRKKVFEDKN